MKRVLETRLHRSYILTRSAPLRSASRAIRFRQAARRNANALESSRDRLYRYRLILVLSGISLIFFYRIRYSRTVSPRDLST